MEHRSDLRRLVDLLLEKETVDGEAVYTLVGVPPPEAGTTAMARPEQADRSGDPPCRADTAGTGPVPVPPEGQATLSP